MENTITFSNYFLVHYGKDDHRIFREEINGNGNENLITAILDFSHRHQECPINKITNIEKVSYNKDTMFDLENCGAELEYDLKAFMYAVKNTDTDKDFNKDDLYTILTLLQNIERKLNIMKKVIDDQCVFFEFSNA